MPIYAISDGLDSWLRGLNRGISSNTIVQHLTGFPALAGAQPSHPHDVPDLGRCIGLLRAAPELVGRLLGMHYCSAVWAGLVDRWDELTRVYLEEEKTSPEQMDQTYDLMRSIIEPLEAAERRPLAELRQELHGTGKLQMNIPGEGVPKELLEVLGARIVGFNKG